jgi:glutamyl-tRNA synthetase
MEACPCRGKSKEENFKRWKKMFKGYKQGDAVARMKTDIKDKNPAMRDFPVFRICEAEHPRQGKKYRVWPLMNMAVLCDDIDSGVTHIIRAKDHTDNAKRQEIMFKYLGKEAPEALFVGRINFKGIPVSCSKTRKAIEEGKYTGWEDIRIPFLLPLRKRGYVRGAFLRYAEEVGMSLTDKTVTMEDYFKALNAYNKELIDEQSYRYFFVWDPVKITIKGAPKQNINLDLYPGKKEKGREFETKEEFFISQDDFEALKEDEVYRLMDCLNFVKKGKSFEFHSKDYKVFKESGKKIIHWIPSDASVKVEVLMADNTVKSGVGELHLKSVKVGQTVQLERFGFCRLEMKEKDSFLFWFGHK